MSRFIRKSTAEDLPEIMRIYDTARQYMRKNGNFNQWINGYPQESLVLNDIQNGNSYVCVEDGGIVGTFFFSHEEDITYRVIEDGSWNSDRPYAVIHRIGSDGKAKGVLKSSVEFALQTADYIRMDTHRDNKPMQAALKKNGFRRCGIIRIEDGTERVAFDFLPKKI